MKSGPREAAFRGGFVRMRGTFALFREPVYIPPVNLHVLFRHCLFVC